MAWKLIIKGVSPVPDLMNTPGVVVTLSLSEVVVTKSGNVRLNEELTIDWIKWVWGSQLWMLSIGMGCLQMPLHSEHRSIVDRQMNLDIAVMSRGLTSQLQPANVSLSKQLRWRRQVL